MGGYIMKTNKFLSVILFSVLGVVACNNPNKGNKNNNFTISLNEHSLDLFTGDTYQLEAETSEEATITWNSSDTSYVTVDDNGLITAVAVGNATITATANGKSDSCEVAVSQRVVNTHTLTTIRSYPLNTMTFDDLQEGQEFEEGEEIEIVMTVVPDFETRPAERYRIYAGNRQLETEVVEGEQKIKATFTVGESDFAIYSYYSDFLPDPDNGVTVTVDNNDNEYEYLGFDKTAKWGKPNGFVILKPNYKITRMEWRYDDVETWTNASTNTMAATFCGNAAQANPNYAQFYIFRVVKNNSRDPLEENIHIRFVIEEIIVKSISYIGSDNPLLNQNTSNFPTSGVVGSTITIDVKPNDGSTKVEATSTDVELRATYNAGQYQFTMPNKDVTITITCTEATVDVIWNRPDGVSSKLVGEDDPATPAFSRVNAGETYYLYASISVANHYVKSAIIGETTYNLTKTGDQDENEHDYYKAQITIPADVGNSVTITLIEEQQPLTISFERPATYRNKMVIAYEGILQEGTVVTVASDSVFAKPLAMTILVNNEATTIAVTEANEYDDEEQKYAYEGSFVMPNSDVKLRFTEIEPETDELTITISGTIYAGNRGMQYSYEGTLQEGTLVTVTNKSTSQFANPQTMTVTVNGHPEITVTVTESSVKEDGAQYYSYVGTFTMPAYSVTLSFSRVTN